MARFTSFVAGTMLVAALGLLAGCGTPAPIGNVANVETLESGIVEADRAYKIEDVLGIGPVYGAKLREAGVTNTEKLQKATTTRYQRQKLAETTGISYKLVLAWAQKVELMTIKGIGPRQSNLLASIGITSSKELARRVPANLHDRLGVANTFTPKFVDNTPSVNTVTKWIDAAKAMPTKISNDE
ncbi:DNA repair and recombination protein RadA [compost metagenome]